MSVHANILKCINVIWEPAHKSQGMLICIMRHVAAAKCLAVRAVPELT